MDADGSNQLRLTYTAREGWRSMVPAWSPDRQKIVFSSGLVGREEIYVMDRDGANIRRLTHMPGKASENPAFSPDGEKIAFASNRDGGFEVFVMAADGSNIQQLTHTGGEGSEDPAWSPDGKWIVFDSKPGQRWELYVMRSDGSELRRLTYGPIESSSSGNPTFSPDGNRILFTSTWDRPSKDWLEVLNNYELYVMDADGSNIRRLTHLPGTSNASPVWSPDGNKILFSSSRDGTTENFRANREIYVMNADGSSLQRLTFNQAWDAHPFW